MSLLVVFLCVGWFASAQESDIQIPDSLKTSSFEELKEQFYVYEAKDLRVAEMYAQAMLSLAKINKNPSQTHKAEHYNARVSTALGKKQIALAFIEKAFNHSRKENDSAYILKNIFLKGKIYDDFGEYTKAIEFYLQASNLVKNNLDQTKFHVISQNIARVKNQINDVRNAIEISRRNLDYFLSQDNREFDIMNCYLLLVSAYCKLAIERQHKPTLKKTYIDSSFYFMKIAHKEAVAYDDSEALTMLAVSEGINYCERNEFERALNILETTEKRATELKLHREFPLIYLFQGKSYYGLQQYEKAITFLQKAIAASKAIEIDFPYLQETFIILAKSYKAVGDIDNAITHYELFYKKKEQNELLNAENNKSLYEEYDIPSFQEQIRELQDKSDHIDTKYKYAKYFAFLLAVALLVIVFLYRKRQQQYKQRFKKLLVHINTLEQQTVAPRKAARTPKDTNKKQLRIPDEKIKEILKNLEKFEEKELFLNNNCSLNFVAKKVQTNSTYFSAILQQHKKKKFVQYITDLRIEYVLKRLKNDGVFRSYDIKSIAYEVGFNTAESFSKAFRKSTGIYPSFFIKNLDKLTNTSKN